MSSNIVLHYEAEVDMMIPMGNDYFCSKEQGGRN